jgi:hypothetical protein
VDVSDRRSDEGAEFKAAVWTAVVFVVAGLAFLFFGRGTEYGEYIGVFVALVGVAGFVSALVRRAGRRRLECQMIGVHRAV